MKFIHIPLAFAMLISTVACEKHEMDCMEPKDNGTNDAAAKEADETKSLGVRGLLDDQTESSHGPQKLDDIELDTIVPVIQIKEVSDGDDESDGGDDSRQSQ